MAARCLTKTADRPGLCCMILSSVMRVRCMSNCQSWADILGGHRDRCMQVLVCHDQSLASGTWHEAHKTQSTFWEVHPQILFAAAPGRCRPKLRKHIRYLYLIELRKPHSYAIPLTPVLACWGAQIFEIADAPKFSKSALERKQLQRKRTDLAGLCLLSSHQPTARAASGVLHGPIRPQAAVGTSAVWHGEARQQWMHSPRLKGVEWPSSLA